MNQEFHNQRQSLVVTDKQASVGNLFDLSKNFTGHMFNINFEEDVDIFFPKIWLVFYVSIFHITLKLFFLFHFNEVRFLERSRYLFNNTYIVTSSLASLYPHQ